MNELWRDGFHWASERLLKAGWELDVAGTHLVRRLSTGTTWLPLAYVAKVGERHLAALQASVVVLMLLASAGCSVTRPSLTDRYESGRADARELLRRYDRGELDPGRRSSISEAEAYNMGVAIETMLWLTDKHYAAPKIEGTLYGVEMSSGTYDYINCFDALEESKEKPYCGGVTH